MSTLLNRKRLATADMTGIIALDLTNQPPTPCSDGSTSAPFCSDFTAFYPLYLGEYTVETDNESWAMFGQATWDITERLDMTLGLRYTDDQREAVRTNDGLLWNSFGPGASDSDLDEPDYTAIIDYRWTDDISTYAKYSTGFRSGGSSRNSLDFNQAFDKETLESFELGWKTEMNARFSLRDVDMFGGNWQFALWVKNLQDEDGVNYAIGTTANTFLTPRMYGGEVIFEF